MSDDRWNGDEYLNRPGHLESAEVNARNIHTAIAASGIPASTFRDLNLLEVGAGVGTVTRHLADFGSVHALEPSGNMIRVLSRLVTDLPNVTFAQHALGPDSASMFTRGQAMPSPIIEDPERQLSPPRDLFRKYGFVDIGSMETEPVPAFGRIDGRTAVPTKVVWGHRAP
ncbi:hypothetical protein CspHIS471_0207210 [Cutaneotrichosporon sp. HIS471]|nr:hypothetical protein CspHIS471_0207210 [Cutaneotrichosporon sp. HIS471]